MKESRPSELARAVEQLRQEHETFAQRKWQDKWWFLLRLSMGAMAVVLLPSVACVSAYVIWNAARFPGAVVAAASGTLFVDVVGIVVAVWKLVIGIGTVTRLTPVTAGPPAEEEEAAPEPQQEKSGGPGRKTA